MPDSNTDVGPGPLAGALPSSVAAQRTGSLSQLPGPRGLPLLGNLLQLRPDRLHRVFEGWETRFGAFYTFRLGPRRCLATSDAATIAQVLRDRPHDYRRLSALEPVLREVGAHGVFSAEGESWRVQRKLVMPAFSMKQQRELYPSIAQFTDRLRQTLDAAARRGEPLEIRDEMVRYTVDVTSYLAFGHDLDTLGNPNCELQEHLSRLFATVNRRTGAVFPYWKYVKLPSDRAADRSLAVVHGLLSERIAAARDAVRDPARAAAPRTLLESMITTQLDGALGPHISDEVLAGNAFTLLLAGEDTTSSTLAWMLHHLAHAPEMQQRAREEADRVLGDARVLQSYDDAAQLRYIQAITYEALRIRSAAPMLFMETLRELTLSGITLPAGTPVFLLTRRAAMREENFSNPDRFEPERWLGSGASADGHRHEPQAALSFGAGPRTCPGRSLALLECAIVTSMVLRNFELHPVGSLDQVKEGYDFTMHPVGLRVRLTPR